MFRGKFTTDLMKTVVRELPKKLQSSSGANFLQRNAMRQMQGPLKQEGVNLTSSVAGAKNDLPITTRAFSTYSKVEFPKNGNSSSGSSDQWQPTSIDEIGPQADLAEELAERRMEIWRGLLEKREKREMTDEEFKEITQDWDKLVKNAFKGAKICRRVEADELLLVLNRGHFTEIYETQEGAGTSFDHRILKQLGEKQRMQFGYPETMLDRSGIHGIATQEDYGGDDDPALRMYGNIAVYFKSDVEQYATATIGNFATQVYRDLDGTQYLNAKAVPFLNPTREILPLTAIERNNPDEPTDFDVRPWIPPKNTTDWPSDLTALRKMLGVPYIEVHIHRILTERNRLEVEHISRVVIREPERLGPKQFLELVVELNKHGISWNIGKSKENSLGLRQKFESVWKATANASPISSEENAFGSIQKENELAIKKGKISYKKSNGKDSGYSSENE